MKVQVHAEGTAKEIAKQLTEHAAIYSGVVLATGNQASKPAKKGKPAAEEEEEFALEDAEESEESEEAEESDESEEVEGEDEVPEHSEVVKAFQKFQKKFGEEKALAKLKKLGFKSVKQIKPEQRANVIASVSL